MYLDTVQKKKKDTHKHDNIVGFIFSFIPVLGFIVFGLIPLVLAIYMSFCEIQGFDVLSGEFVAFQKYGDVIHDPIFWESVRNTFIFGLSLPICMIISLIIAYLLSKKIKFKKVFRVIYFIPYVCSITAVVLMWRWIFNPQYGAINVLFNLDKNWLSDSKLFIQVVLVMSIWGGCGFQIILYGAALTNINPQLYDACKIDGANGFQCFFHVTLPSISPTIFYLLVTGLIGVLQSFAATQILDSTGGPDGVGLTMGFYLYRQIFEYQDSGQGCAAAIIMTFMVLIVTVLNFVLSKKWVRYED